MIVFNLRPELPEKAVSTVATASCLHSAVYLILVEFQEGAGVSRKAKFPCQLTQAVLFRRIYGTYF